MEVSLRKPQREIFNLIKNNPESFIRKYKKSLTATREYWRLMSREYNPIKNITPSRIRPMFDMDLFTQIKEGEFVIKTDATLAVKVKKIKPK